MESSKTRRSYTAEQREAVVADVRTMGVKERADVRRSRRTVPVAPRPRKTSAAPRGGVSNALTRSVRLANVLFRSSDQTKAIAAASRRARAPAVPDLKASLLA